MYRSTEVEICPFCYLAMESLQLVNPVQKRTFTWDYSFELRAFTKCSNDDILWTCVFAAASASSRLRTVCRTTEPTTNGIRSRKMGVDWPAGTWRSGRQGAALGAPPNLSGSGRAGTAVRRATPPYHKLLACYSTAMFFTYLRVEFFTGLRRCERLSEVGCVQINNCFQWLISVGQDCDLMVISLPVYKYPVKNLLGSNCVVMYEMQIDIRKEQ